MLILLGYIIVVASVLGGYALVGGHLGALYQPSELLIIGGAALGAFFVGNNGKSIKKTLKALPKLMRGSKYNKALYMDLMALLYRLMAKSRQQGMLSLERDIEDPAQSEIFANYPRILADKQLVDFITDYLRLMVSGNMNAFEIEALMDEEIETMMHDKMKPYHSIVAIGDSFPAIGIIAAVLGVIKAMSHINESPEVLGGLIGSALVGTMLGIFLSYCFCNPLVSQIKIVRTKQHRLYIIVKQTLLAYMNGSVPQVALEYGRKTISSSDRPSIDSVEQEMMKPVGGDTKAA